MGDVVNLDALILRDDFNSEEGAAAGEQGKSRPARLTCLRAKISISLYASPTFSRETAAWSPKLYAIS